MDVSRNNQGSIELNKVGLAYENLLTFLYKHFDLPLLQVDRLNAKIRRVLLDVVSHFEQGINDAVELLMVDSHVGWRLLVRRPNVV